MPIEVRLAGSRDPLSDPALACQLSQRYLIFDAYLAGVRRVEVHPLFLPREMHEAAARAAERVVATVGRVTARAHVDPAERARYGLSEDSTRLASASHESGDHASLMRVDLLLSEDGEWRACEINADCPGGHNESAGLPRLAREAGFREGDDPTHMLESLADRLTALAALPGEPPGAVALVYATAYAEDLQVCAIVQRMLQRRGTRAILVSPLAPRFDTGELRVGPEIVRALYRYFPTEYMDGNPNVDGICQAVRAGRVRTLSSFAHMYTQSKYAFARAWAHEPTLDAEDRAVVRQHIPASFDFAAVSRERLVAERSEWVLKRAYGRVGDEVFVGSLFDDDDDDWGSTVDAVSAMRSAGESWIAQRFVRQRAVPTPWGDRYVTLGAYVLDGRFVGYFTRITPESHVSHGALCVPVFTEAA
ncbi:MAG TPA: glutathionylspermidine synthase family protein [Polyangiaceae bacterium]|jgi:glutathionylspermidine synthase